MILGVELAAAHRHVLKALTLPETQQSSQKSYFLSNKLHMYGQQTDGLCGVRGCERIRVGCGKLMILFMNHNMVVHT